MELTEIPTNKIRRDPEQPRSAFDDEEIEEMAKSMKTTGLINPIEVDPTGMIITGERRWRAAKKAGLPSIPCKVLVMDKDDRFMRQVIENIHHNTMSDWDTALSLKKLITLAPSPHERKGARGMPAPTGPRAYRGIRWLSERLGKDPKYIAEKLDILEMSAPVQKQVREGSLDTTYLRAITRVPEPFKKQMERKLLDGEFRTSAGALEVAAALSRSPSQAPNLLKQDYSKYKTSADVAVAVSKISPRTTDKIAEAIEPTKQLGHIVTSLIKWMEHNSPDSVGGHNLRRVILNLTTAEEEIKKWLKK